MTDIPERKAHIQTAWQTVIAFVKSDAAPKVVFIAALCGLSFAYGIAVMLFKIFPYGMIKDGEEAFKAVQSLRPDDMPYMFNSFVAEAPTPPFKSAGAGNELILITGGAYQRLDLCPTHGCLAWLIDRDGRVHHAWEFNFGDLIANDSRFAGRVTTFNIQPVGLALDGDGSLVATFHGRNIFPYQIGIVKLDVDGNVLWKRIDHSHHWLTIDENGFIYTPYTDIRNGIVSVGSTHRELRCSSDAVYDEGVRIISPDGDTVREVSFIDLFAREDYTGLLYNLSNDCDPLHVNSVDVLSRDVAPFVPGAEPGDLLVSMREPNTIVLVDHEDYTFKKVIAGRTVAQHTPQFLPNGDVIVFDNLGGDVRFGGSRVVRLNLATDRIETIYPPANAKEGTHFFERQAGHVSASPDGRRALASTHSTGKVIEFDLTDGRLLWSYVNIQSAEKFGKTLGIKPEEDYALFAIQGAYYVPDASFLDRRP